MSLNPDSRSVSANPPPGPAAASRPRPDHPDRTWLLLPILALFIVTLLFLDWRPMVEPSLWTAAFNALILSGPSLAAAGMAARGFMAGGGDKVLFLSCGSLVFGTAALTGSALAALGRVDSGAALQAAGALIAGAFHAAGALRVLSPSMPPSTQDRRGRLVRLYALAAAALAAIGIWIGLGLMPAFLPSPGGSPLRAAVLAWSAAESAAAALLFHIQAPPEGGVFQRRYGLGLALTGLGLAAAALVPAGSFLDWLGRLTQGLGQLFLPFGLVAARRGPRSLSDRWGGDLVGSLRLRFFEDEQRAVMEAAAEGVLVLDERDTVAYASQRLAEMIDRPAAAIFGRPLADLLSQRLLPPERERFRQRLREADQKDVEIPFDRPGETDCWIRLNSSIIRDARGRLRKVVLVLSDITELRAFDQALRQARAAHEKTVEERTAQLQETVKALEKEMAERHVAQRQLSQLSRVFMDAADPIIIEDLSGTVTAMNREAEKAYGWKSDELIGESIYHIFPSRRRERAGWLRKLSGQGAEIRDWEGVRQDRTGKEIPVLLTLFPLHDETGRISALASIAKDISIRKKLEGVLKESQERLKEISRKSIDALEADRKAVSRELHDGIGSSLSAVKFLLEEVAEQLREAPAAAGPLLMKGIAYLSDIIKESKRLSVNLRPLSLDDLGLLATITGYIRQFKEQNPRITTVAHIEISEDEIPDTLKIVIYRILQESLTNVARHSQAGRIDIRLKQQNDLIELEVEDDGRGFDLRRQMDNKDPFSGFGLKSMQERAEICCGTMSIATEPGHGTRLRIKLPLGGDSLKERMRAAGAD
jgi:PAS domain S-box-containing protein